MVKAKDFWNYLCNDLDYRFFSGVACPGLSPLYKAMKSDFMHYVPAVNESIGIGLVMGARLSGMKGGLLIDMRFIHNITNFVNFSAKNNIPLLIVGHMYDGDSIVNYEFPVAYVVNDSFKDDVSRVATQSEKEKAPGLIVFDGEALI